MSLHRLRISQTKAAKSYILSWGPLTTWHHFAQALTIENILLGYAVLQEFLDSGWILHRWRDEDPLETIPEASIADIPHLNRFTIDAILNLN